MAGPSTQRPAALNEGVLLSLATLVGKTCAVGRGGECAGVGSWAGKEEDGAVAGGPTQKRNGKGTGLKMQLGCGRRGLSEAWPWGLLVRGGADMAVGVEQAQEGEDGWCFKVSHSVTIARSPSRPGVATTSSPLPPPSPWPRPCGPLRIFPPVVLAR
jgi:hypothetical protein